MIVVMIGMMLLVTLMVCIVADAFERLIDETVEKRHEAVAAKDGK